VELANDLETKENATIRYYTVEVENRLKSFSFGPDKTRAKPTWYFAGSYLRFSACYVQSLSEVVGTHVVLACKWIITVFYTQNHSPPPPPTSNNVV
jgi:hypothetical protein